jgi:hypothetical protein
VSLKVVSVVIIGDTAAPEILVFPACAVVQSAKSVFEMTHDCMPLVTQPMVLFRLRSSVSVFAIFSGVATSTIAAFPTDTEHCALAVVTGEALALVQVTA